MHQSSSSRNLQVVQDIDSNRLSVGSQSSTAPPSYTSVAWDSDPRVETASVESAEEPRRGSPSPNASAVRVSSQIRSPSPARAAESVVASQTNDRLVIASWNGPSSPLSERASYTGTVPTHSAAGAQPGENKRLMTCSFSSLSGTSMLLLPPASASDTRPLYHISVGQHCFQPASYITTVRRGGSESGTFVGDFEMGATKRVDRVCIGDSQTTIKQALTRSRTRNNGEQWLWSFEGVKLSWSFHGASKAQSQNMKCQLENSSLFSKITKHVATLTRPAPDIVPAKRTEEQLSELLIFPEGQEYLDHILMSALIIERMRSA